MTFEEAVWIGLGLKVEGSDVTVPAERVQCPDCRADYLTTDWQDKASCKWCYSSNVRVSSAPLK